MEWARVGRAKAERPELESRHDQRAKADRAKAGRGKRRRRRTALIAGVAVVAVGVGGGVAIAASRDSGPSYRTVDAATGAVEQTVTATGTVTSAKRRDAAFTTSGTVASVAVAAGDTVKAGQTLAKLDTTSLQQAVDDAEQSVSDAQDTLNSDLEAQANGTASTTTGSGSTGNGSTGNNSTSGTGLTGTGSTGTGSTGTASTGIGNASSTSSGSVSSGAYVVGSAEIRATAATAAAAPSGSSGSSSTSKERAAVTAAQKALSDQYKDTQTVQTNASAAADTATTQCQAFLAATLSTDTTPDASGTSPAEQSLKDAQGNLTACQTALSTAVTAQSDAVAAQATLMDKVDALNKAVSALEAAIDKGGSGGSGSGGSGSGGSGSGSGGSGSGGSGQSGSGSSTPQVPSGSDSNSGAGGSSGTKGSGSSSSGMGSSGTGSTGQGSTSGSATTGQKVTAEQIVSDESALTLADNKLTQAKQALAMATLTAPISGTVAQVGITAGDSVSASSTSQVITIVDDGGAVVEISVPLGVIDKVKVGQDADVTLGTSSEVVSGTVSSVGVQNTSSNSTPEYTVKLAVDPGKQKIYDGSSAQAVVTVSSTKGAVTVPTSAVHVDGTKTTVQVLKDGKAKSVSVKVGAVGDQVTQISSGVATGQKVIVADLSKSLDSLTGTSDNKSSSSGGLLSGTNSGGQGGMSGGQMPGMGSRAVPGGS